MDLLQIRAGEFIDLENYFVELSKNNSDEIALKFLDLLCNGNIPKGEDEIIEVIKEYARQVTEIKETYTWIFNPPPLPSSIEKEIKNRHLLDDFQKDYSGYIEIIYLLCVGDMTKVDLVKEMKVQDFFFWGEYLYRKRYIESVK